MNKYILRGSVFTACFIMAFGMYVSHNQGNFAAMIAYGVAILALAAAFVLGKR